MSEIPTPENPGNLSPRQLASYVQTNVTRDHDVALRWATTAFRTATMSHVRDDDPTLASEIARNAAVHAELGGRSVSEVSVWLTNSETMLLGDSPRINRERAASLFIGASVLHHQFRTGRSLISAHQIDRRFLAAKKILRDLHENDEPWDRYFTMLLRRWSTFASDEINPRHDAYLGFILAFHGIQTALYADREENTLARHLGFVTKQAGANALAGLVATAYPARNVPLIGALRRRVQRRLFG